MIHRSQDGFRHAVHGHDLPPVFSQGAKRHGEVCEVFPLASRETSWLFGLGEFDDNI